MAFADHGAIDLASLGFSFFQAAIVLGGIVLGGYVDRSKEYKQTTLLCLGAAFLLLIPFGLVCCSALPPTPASRPPCL